MLKINIFLSPVIMILIIFIGCDSKHQDKIIIHGLLTTNYHPVYDVKDIYDTTLSRTTVVVGGFKKDYIRGANVIISSNEQSIHLTGIDKDEAYTYQDTGNHLIITSGKTYSLYVKIPDGREFESETTIPNDPVILQPLNNDTLIYGQDLIEYSRSDSNIYCNTPYVYQIDPKTYIQLHIKTSFEPPVGGFTYIIGNYDSVKNFIRISGNEIQKKQIDLLTLDSSFSMYSWVRTYFMHGSDSLFDEYYNKYSEMPLSAVSNIRGVNVVGCFGSYSRTSSVYYLRKP